jgi:ABC-2 type transport system ATP-binding protein
MISLQNVSKRYRQKIVYEALTLEVPAHQLTVIVGENGIGKSTLLKMMACIERPDRGNIVYDREEWGKKEQQQFIGYVPQDIALWEHMTLEANIQFFKSLVKAPIPDDDIAAYVEMLGIAPYLKTVVRKLSGGTQRKANLLIGLLSAPRLLILDEPTVGIDLKSRTDIQQLLQQLKAHMTIVMTTHLLDEMTQFADHTILIGHDPFYEQVLVESGQTFTKI